MLIPYSICATIIRLIHEEAPKKLIHVGAHTGEEAGVYAEWGIEEAIWFESNPDCLPELYETLSTSTMRNQVVEFGLWDSNTTRTFYKTTNVQSSSFFDLEKHKEHYPGIHVKETLQLPLFRFDDIVRDGKGILFGDCDFLVIDTQGAELAILRGFGAHLEGESLKGIFVEANYEPMYSGIPMIEEIDAFLTPKGFSRIVTQWTNEGWGDAFYLKHAVRRG